jgi:anti-anti-sigma factor
VELKVNQTGEHVGFVVSGIIDKKGAELLEKKFFELNVSELKELVLDLGNVRYIASPGVNKLLMFYKKMTTNGGRLRIENDTGVFHELLKITKMNFLIQCYGN